MLTENEARPGTSWTSCSGEVIDRVWSLAVHNRLVITRELVSRARAHFHVGIRGLHEASINCRSLGEGQYYSGDSGFRSHEDPIWSDVSRSVFRRITFKAWGLPHKRFQASLPACHMMMMIVIIVAVVVVVVKASRRTSKLATSLTIQWFHNCECLTLYNSGAHRRAIVCLPRASTFLSERGKGASNNIRIERRLLEVWK